MAHCGKTQPTPMASPCTRQCGLIKGHLCQGCYRTRHEIMGWSRMSASDRMALMQQLKGQVSTHDCPSCTGPAYCAMEAGKSASLCWCMEEECTTNVNTDYGDKCLCRQCLAKEHLATEVT